MLIKDNILYDKTIAVRDLLLEAQEQQHKVVITIGYIEIKGIIQEIENDNLIIKCEDLEFNVVF